MCRKGWFSQRRSHINSYTCVMYFTPSKKPYKNKEILQEYLAGLVDSCKKRPICFAFARSCKTLAGILHKYTCKIPASVLQDSCKILQNARQRGFFLQECTSLVAGAHQVS